jgi:hypothetical protein
LGCSSLHAAIVSRDGDDEQNLFHHGISGGRAGDEARETKRSQTGKDVIAVSHLIVSLTLPLLFAGH